MMARRLARLLEKKALLESAIPPNFFANRLGLNDPACGIYAVDDAGGIRFEYTVPEAALMGGGELPLSSMLAIADDVTTWAAVGADRYSRPGVSVELSLTRSRARPVRAGDRIVVSPLVTKLGRAMAMRITCSSLAETFGSAGLRCCSVPRAGPM